jgi:hypothetical protein
MAPSPGGVARAAMVSVRTGSVIYMERINSGSSVFKIIIPKICGPLFVYKYFAAQISAIL